MPKPPSRIHIITSDSNSREKKDLSYLLRNYWLQLYHHFSFLKRPGIVRLLPQWVSQLNDVNHLNFLNGGPHNVAFTLNGFVTRILILDELNLNM